MVWKKDDLFTFYLRLLQTFLPFKWGTACPQKKYLFEEKCLSVVEVKFYAINAIYTKK